MSLLLKDLQAVRTASRKLANLSPRKITAILKNLAKKIQSEKTFILKQNQKDLRKMNSQDPRYDRLQLTEQRLEAIAQDIIAVSNLENPLAQILAQRTMPNGLKISKITVPFGVIGIIYEARPNVTLDVFTLCLKSGNACVLKGGQDAGFSNLALVKIIRQVLTEQGVDKNIICLLSNDKKEVTAMLKAHDLIDVIIPRGSKGLIDFVRENSTIPVIETGAGVVHTYVDESGDLKKAQAIVLNAKTRRPSVCNTLDTLIIHQQRLVDLPVLVKPLLQQAVTIFADPQSYRTLQASYDLKLLRHAKKEHFGMEYLSLKMSIKTVNNLQEALDHIRRYSSKHSEAIVSTKPKNIQTFFQNVDAAVVYANASTAFTDGAQFGLGAEIGISTQKLHARGPMGLKEMTTYKWIVEGDGQVRKS